MNMTDRQYCDYIKSRAPRSPILKNSVKAFVIGGLICCVGQLITGLLTKAGLQKQDASAACSVILVFLGALLTGLGVYDTIAKAAGAGTLVPITGFANSITAPAMEFKTEGFITGTAVKMFTIAGPVIVFGTLASVVYGILLLIFGKA